MSPLKISTLAWALAAFAQNEAFNSLPGNGSCLWGYHVHWRFGIPQNTHKVRLRNVGCLEPSLRLTLAFRFSRPSHWIVQPFLGRKEICLIWHPKSKASFSGTRNWNMLKLENEFGPCVRILHRQRVSFSTVGFLEKLSRIEWSIIPDTKCLIALHQRQVLL